MTTYLRPNTATIRDLVDLAERDDLGAQTLARLVAALTGQDNTLLLGRHATDALEAASIIRRLTDGTLDIATLVSEPTTVSFDSILEATLEAYHHELDIECGYLAGAL